MHAVIRLLLLVSFETNPATSVILRLPCKQYADFRVFEFGKRLVNNTLMTLDGMTDVGCMMACIEQAQCRSYNINVNESKCELNAKALVDNGTMLVDDKDWLYKSTDFNQTAVGPVCNQLTPCKSNVLCVDTCDYPFYKCKYCDENHEGLHCDKFKDRNECGSNPCKNSGTCIDKYADYQCNCLLGFAGKNCEIEINECSSLPCFNGGTCVNEVGRFICTCTSVWTGMQCETGGLNITILSTGKSDPFYAENSRRTIKVNDWKMDEGCTGFRISVLSGDDGSLMMNSCFNTYGFESESIKMVDSLNSAANGSIILVAVVDSAENRLTQEAKRALNDLGATATDSLQRRESFALLTRKCSQKPVWFAEKHALQGEGPTIIQSVIGAEHLGLKCP